MKNTAQACFVTTAIDYPNALPHIGTAFEKIGADVYSRWKRFLGSNVFFSMGNDENTVKVKRVVDSLDQKISYKNYVDEMAVNFKAIWSALDISFDDFIQTSEERHKIGVQLFLNAVKSAGYIEKRNYQSFYCEGCEEFKTANSIENEKCPYHPNTPLVLRDEENWFFLLSQFKQRLLSFYEEESIKILPKSRFNEVKNFVEGDLQDVSISRKNEGWGIPLPWDHAQVTYVWFDALLNYLTVIGFGQDWEKFEKFWPADCHIIGKDITRFHCALFPAMCMAYNEGCDNYEARPLHSLPVKVFAHGFVYERKGDELVKSSKSNSGITPIELIEKFGKDAYRYYFLSKFNFAQDGQYCLENFTEVYNSDLANSLGNLVSRTIGMTLQYCDGKLSCDLAKENILWFSESDLLNYYEAMEKMDFRSALEIVWKIVSSANQYIDQEKPWELAKLEESKGKLNCTLAKLVVNLKLISALLKPCLPMTSKKIYETFIWKDSWDCIDYNSLLKSSKNDFCDLGLLCVNMEILGEDRKFSPLFPRIK